MSGVEKDVTCEVQDMLNTLKAQDVVTSLDMEGFSTMLKAQIIGIENAFRDHQKDYAKEMK